MIPYVGFFSYLALELCLGALGLLLNTLELSLHGGRLLRRCGCRARLLAQCGERGLEIHNFVLLGIVRDMRLADHGGEMFLAAATVLLLLLELRVQRGCLLELCLGAALADSAASTCFEHVCNGSAVLRHFVEQRQVLVCGSLEQRHGIARRCLRLRSCPKLYPQGRLYGQIMHNKRGL
jgi:hypothetical protein